MDSSCSGKFTTRAFLGILIELVPRQERPEEESPLPYQCLACLLPVLSSPALTYKIGKISKNLALTASNWLRNHNPIKHIFQWGRGFQLIFYTLCFSNSAGLFFPPPLLLMSKTELKLEQGLKIELFAGERHIT